MGNQVLRGSTRCLRQRQAIIREKETGLSKNLRARVREKLEILPSTRQTIFSLNASKKLWEIEGLSDGALKVLLRANNGAKRVESIIDLTKFHDPLRDSAFERSVLSRLFAACIHHLPTWPVIVNFEDLVTKRGTKGRQIKIAHVLYFNIQRTIVSNTTEYDRVQQAGKLIGGMCRRQSSIVLFFHRITSQDSAGDAGGNLLCCCSCRPKIVFLPHISSMPPFLQSWSRSLWYRGTTATL